MTTIIIEAESVERLLVPVRANVDPTGALPRWAFLAPGVRPTAPDWTAGSWLGPADEIGDCVFRATAVSPQIGAAPFDLVPGTYHAWLQLSIAGDAPVYRLATIIKVRG